VKCTTAPYKYPRAIEFVPELPKTLSGKINRNELRLQEERKYNNSKKSLFPCRIEPISKTAVPSFCHGVMTSPNYAE